MISLLNIYAEKGIAFGFVFLEVDYSSPRSFFSIIWDDYGKRLVIDVLFVEFKININTKL